MHWGSSFFVLFCLLGLVICLLPVRLQFHAQHQQQWNSDITIRFLGLHYTKKLGGQPELVHKQNQKSSVQEDMHSTVHNNASYEDVVQSSETGFSVRKTKSIKRKRKQQQREWRFQAHWRNIIKFFWRAGSVVLRQLSLEQLSLRCNIGFQQPDRTAYSYALFWAVLSVLPPKWLEQAEISYVPDFQQQRQDIQLQGIICTSVGKIMHIVFSLLWLVVQAKLEQDRKEQMVYEN